MRASAQGERRRREHSQKTNRSSSSTSFQLGESKGVEALGMLLRVPAHVVTSKNRTQDLCCKIACTPPVLRPPYCDSSARISSSAACARPEIPQLGKQLHIIRPQALHFFLRGFLLPVQPAVSRRQTERARAAASKRACLRCVAASRSSCSMRARSCWRCTDRIPVIASSLVVATIAEAGDGPGAAGVVANSAERDAASEAAGRLLAADETADAAGDTLPSGVNTKCD